MLDVAGRFGSFAIGPESAQQTHLTSGHIFPGRGVFASCSISAGTVVDISPVLVFPNQEVDDHASQTILQHYT